MRITMRPILRKAIRCGVFFAELNKYAYPVTKNFSCLPLQIPHYCLFCITKQLEIPSPSPLGEWGGEEKCPLKTGCRAEVLCEPIAGVCGLSPVGFRGNSLIGARGAVPSEAEDIFKIDICASNFIENSVYKYHLGPTCVASWPLRS